MSFWQRLFGSIKPQREPLQSIAMVLLPDTEPVSGRAILDRLAASWEGVPKVSGLDSSDGATVATFPGGGLALVQIPGPIPLEELSGPAQLAWHWKEARDAVAAHRSHIIVQARSDEMDVLDLRLFHTRLVAATVEEAKAVGVYVGDAMLVRFADAYVEDARSASREALPILSWVGFNAVGEDGGALSAYTTGLSIFGIRELEVRRTHQSFNEVVNTLADLAHYQLVSGRTIRDGDTFGATESERTRVRFAQSEFIPAADVAVVEVS